MSDDAPAPLVDAFGREARDLRVSLTDRCPLRCTYCMPEQGLDWLRRADVLDDDEVVRLVDVATRRCGVREVRLTGGEPLVRAGVVDLVARLAGLPARPHLAMTTAGVSLARVAEPLAAAGLDRVTVSLDTLDAERYRAVTRRDRLADVLAGLAAAREAGLEPVKVNAVLVRGVNEDEAADLLAWCLERGLHLRFVEPMPLDGDHAWRPEQVVGREELLGLLRSRFDVRPAPGREADPAEPFEVRAPDGGPVLGDVGLVAPVSAPFCGSCDRLRLTADGQLRACLFAAAETDLRGPLRDGADDEDLERLLRDAVAGKQAGHGIGTASFVAASRSMSAIGG